MGFRIPAVVVSPYARPAHVDHTIYGFESILKMIRYRYGLAPLTPRDLYANNIAAAFDFESKPKLTPPSLPQPPEVISAECTDAMPVDSSGNVGIDDGTLLGSPITGLPTIQPPPLPLERPKPHDLDRLLTSGYLERLHFKYRAATPATMFRHPSKLGLRG
jgi:phospholipase C